MTALIPLRDLKLKVATLPHIVLLVLNLGSFAVFAQSTSGVDLPSNAAAQQNSVAVRPPVIDPAIELRGPELVKALRAGGYVLYMRHATNGPGNTGSDSPCPQGDSPLTEEGRLQAKAVGIAIGQLGIRIGRVLSSMTCRTRMTGELVAGTTVELSADLNPFNPAEAKDSVALRQALLNRPPEAGTNTLLVSHFHGAPNPTDRLFLDMAEIIVFSPQKAARSLPIARLPHTLWTELLRTNDLRR